MIFFFYYLVSGWILAIIRPDTGYGKNGRIVTGYPFTRSSLGTHQNTWCCHHLGLRRGLRQSHRLESHLVAIAPSRSAPLAPPPSCIRSTTFSSSTGLGAHNDETVSETSHI